MKIIKSKTEFNDFTLKGLTMGKLSAIQRALEFAESLDQLGPVGYDVKVFLQGELSKKEYES